MHTYLPWIYLISAGILEIVWAVGLKYTQGFTRVWPSFFTLIAMGASFFLLCAAVREIPLGTAYTVWVGIGVLGTILCGIFIFKESADFSKLFFCSLILTGIVGIKLTSSEKSSCRIEE